MQIPGLAIREVPTISPADLLGKDKWQLTLFHPENGPL